MIVSIGGIAAVHSASLIKPEDALACNWFLDFEPESIFDQFTPPSVETSAGMIFSMKQLFRNPVFLVILAIPCLPLLGIRITGTSIFLLSLFIVLIYYVFTLFLGPPKIDSLDLTNENHVDSEFAVPSMGNTAETCNVFDQIDRWFQQLHENDQFNGAVLIVKSGKVELKQTYGFTDASKTKRLSHSSSFRLASLSKQFTALGILVLVQRGEVCLDDPIAKHLESFPYADVSIRHLLNQTSGIPDNYMQLAKKFKRQIGNVLTIEKTVELIIQHAVRSKPISNKKYEYSNTNYVLLAAIIEKITANSFEDFMAGNVFGPLGMKNSRVWNLLSKEGMFENQTSCFTTVMKQTIELTPDYLDGVAGDGGVFSSLDDLVVWNEFLRNPRLVSSNLLKMCFEKAVLNDGSYSSYGFGWVVEEHKIWHNGAWLGANTYISLRRNDDVTLVVLDNSNNLRFDSICEELENQLEGERGGI